MERSTSWEAKVWKAWSFKPWRRTILSLTDGKKWACWPNLVDITLHRRSMERFGRVVERVRCWKLSRPTNWCSFRFFTNVPSIRSSIGCSRTVDPRPEEWKRSLSTMTISEPRQQHCLTSINNQILLFGGGGSNLFSFLSKIVSLPAGCDRNGDDARNLQSIVRVIDRSLETTPKWEHLPVQLNHPHTDCGYFQLGKGDQKRSISFSSKTRNSVGVENRCSCRWKELEEKKNRILSRAHCSSIIDLDDDKEENSSGNASVGSFPLESSQWHPASNQPPHSKVSYDPNTRKNLIRLFFALLNRHLLHRFSVRQGQRWNSSFRHSFLGTSLFVIGGHNSENGHPTKMIERIDVNNAGTISVEEEFELEKNLAAVDCCVVQTSKYNEHLLPLAAFLDRWVVW